MYKKTYILIFILIFFTSCNTDSDLTIDSNTGSLDKQHESVLINTGIVVTDIEKQEKVYKNKQKSDIAEREKKENKQQIAEMQKYEEKLKKQQIAEMQKYEEDLKKQQMAEILKGEEEYNKK